MHLNSSYTAILHAMQNSLFQAYFCKALAQVLLFAKIVNESLDPSPRTIGSGAPF